MTIIKRLLLNWLMGNTLLSVIILSVVLSFVPLKVSAGITVIIAASDSSSQWKSQAMVICDGTADQSEINTYLTTGNTVYLAPGTFQIDDWIIPQANSRLTGQGDNSVINLNNTAILVSDVNNVELDHFKLSGTGYLPGAVLITAVNTTASGFYVHDIWNTTKGCNDFLIYANTNRKLSDIAFVRCDADNSDGFGFIISGEGTNPTLEDVTFYKCRVENAGVAPTRLLASDGVSWITGFDFAEYPTPDLIVKRLQVINCSANGAWESDYHFEGAPTKQDVVMIDCSATNAGQKTGGATYGVGYFIDGTQDIVFNGNTGSNNSVADLTIWNGGNSLTNYTPAQNMLLPTSSTKTVSRVDQSNCSGTIISTDSTHEELVLYSNNGNPVNQQIELGDYYASNDGKTYSFIATKIVAQFTDYAVIRLVKTAPPTTTTTTTTNTTTTTTTTPPTTSTAPLTTITTLPTTTITAVGPKVKQFVLPTLLLETALVIFALLLLFGSVWFGFKIINRDGTLNLTFIIFFVLSLLVILSIMAIIINMF